MEETDRMKRPKLRFEKWHANALISSKGTVRTVPENYFVAEIINRGDVKFLGIEAMTRDVDKAYVRKWWSEHEHLAFNTRRS
jgi:hypothetical protein